MQEIQANKAGHSSQAVDVTVITGAFDPDELLRDSTSCPLPWCKLHAEVACQTRVTVGL